MLSDSARSVQNPLDTPPFTWTSRRTLALVVLCAAQALDGVDVTVVNVALPSIQQQLGFSAGRLPLLVNAYMIPFGGFLLLGGRAGDLLGRRRVFLAGLALFTIASLGAALAVGQGELIAARAAQGLAAAAIAPMTLALITEIFPAGRHRNRAVAVWGAVFGASGALGLLLGGLLVTGPGWRWIFIVTASLGVVLLAAGLLCVPGDRRERARRRFDLVGAATSSAGFGLVAYAVLQTETHAWGSLRTIALFAGALLLLAYLVVHETRIAREPLIALSLLSLRTLAGANVVNALRGGAMYAMFYFATLYLQQVLDRSALTTGLAYLPLTAASVVASASAPTLVRRLGSRWVMAGGAVVGLVGALLFIRITPDGSLLADVILPSVVLSLGLGTVLVPVTVAGLSHVPTGHSGAASGMLNVSLQMGGALGLAVLSAVATLASNGQLAAHRATEVALTHGFRIGFVLAAALMAATALAAVVLFRDEGRGQEVNLTDLMRGTD